MISVPADRKKVRMFVYINHSHSDSGGSGDAGVESAVRNKPPILVGMPEKVVNNSCAETDSNTSIINRIAIHRSGYEKEGFLDGHPYAGVGTKFFQLALTPDGWRIIYQLWEDQE